MPKYSREQLLEIYKKLPEDLQEAIYSQQSADNIQDVCVKNGVDERKIIDVAEYVGYVLLGLLPPNEFEKALEKEAGIEAKKAKQISNQLTRFVFLPVRDSLEALYGIKIMPGAEAPAPDLAKKISQRPKKKDTYREPIK